MKVDVQGHSAYCYTGGKPFDTAKPTVVFIHGVVNDHSVWVLQSRYFAHHGFNVLALDLPGHGKSGGDCPKTVEEAAAWVLALLDAAQVKTAALVGHSWGSLIALHAASLAPERVSQLALLGTAFPMKVSPALMDATENAPQQAIDMVNTFSHSTLSPPPSCYGPGTWLYGGSRALMRRVLAGNPHENVFRIGFGACNSYQGALAAMEIWNKSAKIAVEPARAATLFIAGALDQMTPPKAAQALIAAAHNAQTVQVPAGHNMMTEAPEETLKALAAFLQP